MKGLKILLCVEAIFIIFALYIYLATPEWSDDSWEMNAEEAVEYCRNLREHGHMDWKLPKTHDLVGKRLKGIYWASDGSLDDKDFLSQTKQVICIRWNLSKISESENELYQKAKKRNNRATWEDYLREFKKGEYSLEARIKIGRMKKEKIGNLEWSDRSDKRITWQDAPTYCEKLDEDGSGWHLPDIDELRLLIKNRETATGGSCNVSNECLLSDEKNGCWTWKSCAETCKTHTFEDCDKYDDGRYSKLGDDTIWLWASSAPPNYKLYAWSVDFRDGHIGLRLKSDAIFVRCVR